MSNQRWSSLVVGGGLVGPVMAMYLKRRGHDVTVFEKRPDIRQDLKDRGRSINLIITSRGQHALRQLNIWEDVKKHTTMVYGRMMHATDGTLTYQPYGINETECNYSISRNELNKILITLAEQVGIKFFFDHECLDGDLANAWLTFKTPSGPTTKQFDRVFATDGAGSAIRKLLIKANIQNGIVCTEKIQPLGADYKELLMPANASGEFAMDKKSLHIWPRGDHMLMALPNQDGSFTMTMYLPEHGDVSFASVDPCQLFAQKFKDAVGLIPDYLEQFTHNPIGKLATLRMNPWHFQDKAVLLGDAAHAIVPFFGQGMNSGFEDCSTLDRLLTETNNDWGKSFARFTQEHRPNGDAIADMAIENYHEMQSAVADPKFLLCKQVEQVLRQEFPNDYKNRYALVTYSLVPFYHTKKIGEIQSEIMRQLVKKIDNISGLDIGFAKTLIQEKLIPYQKEHGINVSDC